MYTPEIFGEQNRAEITAMIRSCGLATLVTNSAQGLLASPIPMFYAADEGEYGVLYGHISKANPQWRESLAQEALVIFQGPNAYITPAWYPSKAETGRVVPTWNYLAVHTYGPAEFFHERDRLLQVVSHLTSLYESDRPKSWSIDDVPSEYLESQLRAIVGIRVPILRIEAKKKMSQNQSAQNRAGVKAGLAESPFEGDRQVSEIIPG